MSQLTARVDLTPSRRAPAGARRFTEAVLRAWGLADDGAESGRGVELVRALAERWGVDEHHGGKRVWVQLGGGRRCDGP